MKKIVFKIHICGMSNRNFTRKIMIYKPYKTFKVKTFFDDTLLKNYRFSQLLEDIKNENIIKECEVSYFSLNDLNWENIYIKLRGTLFSLQTNKNVLEVFNFFKTNKIEITYIFVAGGASTWCSGYQFVVHSNEAIHIHKPHVHVIKDDMSVRYSLETLERFPQDNFSREYKRDEKKIIIPALKKNRKKLWDYWNCYMGGYCSPTIDCQGREYYKES